ncbi:integrin beta-PS, partial [Asbolus verrucosus]
EHSGHCLHEKDFNSQWCKSSLLEKPQNFSKIVEDKPLSSATGQVVQIAPQIVKLRLRREQEYTLQFQYAQAKNYPIDLYYIMDLSASMEDHKEKLAKLGEELARTMRNITDNFQLGFGSFVDKVDLPFVSTLPKKLKNPCNKPAKLSKCVSPYSFKNHMSLSTDYKKFSNEVLQAKVSANLDSPEGGFDALMQAIVCKNEIGWRSDARHLLVFSTDADFHIAGDGKLAGVIEPNDAQCHMKNHSYTHDLILDYPSVSQINHVAKENNINIIFAIVNKNRPVKYYRSLSEEIENSNMGILDTKSENVINLVLDNYNVNDNSSCIKPDNNNLICNGQGTCNCGKCECFDETGYSGKYCDECATCSAQRCGELRNCVECQAYKSGIYSEDECRANCTAFNTEIVEKIDSESDENSKICTLLDDKECTLVFQYEYGSNGELKVKTEKAKFCPEPPNILETCSECIQELGCVWCIRPETPGHCKHEKDSNPQWCKSDLLENPKSSFEIVEDRPLTSVTGSVVQIKPQKIKLSLRRGQEYTLRFQYAQAENYPVDLYYIMDLSASMEDHREKLAKLGDKLARTMINITKNFQLGFGSFVDKVDLPFVSTVPQKLQQPCTLKKNGKTVVCVSPYSFKNHMSLSKDYNKFSSEVFRAKVSGNLDAPEGGFDALMQAIVCKNEIGWRSNARHLLVFSTDADFHIAGDGKLAGVIEPNDAQCHMEKHLYTHDLILDYPSVSQINYVAKENNVNIIFAIVNKQRAVTSYRSLSEMIENSNMGALDERSDNVINLVIDNYNKIVDSVTISTNSSNDVEIKINSTCPYPKINGCTNIHVGEIVDFTATIKPLECTKGSTKKTIYIKPEAIEESIAIDLEVLCDCNCELPSSPFYETQSSDCHNSGSLKCGVCDCDTGFFGRTCECSSENSQSVDVSNCKPNASDAILCSGLGVCKCGQCICNERSNPGEKIFGKFCDCDNYSCKRVDGKLCSQRGTCDCGGVCKCHAGWTGDACQCPDDESLCVKPGDNNLVCSGHGMCNCGRCECSDEKVRYSGKYCDECPTCSGQRCEELRDCVECQTYESGVYNKDECKANCTRFATEIVEKIESEQDENVKICTIVDDEGCTFKFQYEYGNNEELKVKAEKEKFCPAPPNVLAWVLGVIGSILLAGLIILIIWKIFTTVHDRMEYARFENERKNLRWHRNDNPLYKQATSTFANPAYRKSRSAAKNKS